MTSILLSTPIALIVAGILLLVADWMFDIKQISIVHPIIAIGGGLYLLVTKHKDTLSGYLEKLMNKNGGNAMADKVTETDLTTEEKLLHLLPENRLGDFVCLEYLKRRLNSIEEGNRKEAWQALIVLNNAFFASMPQQGVDEDSDTKPKPEPNK